MKKKWQPQGSCIGKSIHQFIFGFRIHSNLICTNPDWRWLTFLKFLVSKSMAKVANRTLSDSSDELVLLFCTLNLIGRAILCQVLPEILSPENLSEMSCLSQVSAMILQRVTRCVQKEKLCLSLSWKTTLYWLQDSSCSAQMPVAFARLSMSAASTF